MTSIGSDLENVLVTERELWQDGPPHELFKELRASARCTGPRDHRVPGRGRLLVGHHRGRRPRGQPRLADLLVRARRHHGGHERLPARAGPGDVHRDGPAQARPHQGAVPGGLHAEADRRARGRDPRDRRRRARPARGPRDLRPRHRRRPARRLARDRQLHGHPAGGRRGVGEPDELDARRRRPGPEPGRASRASSTRTSPRSSSAAGS